MAFKEEQWYDRKPISMSAYWDVTNAPHGTTVRRTYTCPKGKIAMVELLQVEVVRMIAAGTVGLASSFVRVTPTGQAIGDIVLAARIPTNVVGDRAEASLGTTFTMVEGDRLDLVTNDFSIGGTVREFAAYKLSEFDAYLYPDIQKTRPIPLAEDVQEPKKEPSIVEWVKDLFTPDPVM